MSEAEGAPRKKDRFMQAADVRPDYEEKKNWSFGEAADYVQLRMETVRNYHSSPVKCADGKRRYRWHAGLVRGALKIDTASFKEWARTGEPQGAVYPEDE